jgi:hypothetical protein
MPRVTVRIAGGGRQVPGGAGDELRPDRPDLPWEECYDPVDRGGRDPANLYELAGLGRQRWSLVQTNPAIRSSRCLECRGLVLRDRSPAVVWWLAAANGEYRGACLDRRRWIMTTAAAGAIGIAGAMGSGGFGYPWRASRPARILARRRRGTVLKSPRHEPHKRRMVARSSTSQTDGRYRTQGFLSVVGFWTIGAEGDNKFLVVDGRRWTQGQPALTWRTRRAIYMSVTPNFSTMFKPTPTSPTPSRKGSTISAVARSASASSRSPAASIRAPVFCST